MNKIIFISFILLLTTSNSFAQYSAKSGESLALDWPDEENWKVGSIQNNSQMELIEIIKDYETFDNWTEMGSMISYKGVKNRDVEEVMNLLFKSIKDDCSEANLTVLDKNITSANPWIIYSIECPKYKKSNTPESQVWYLIQGREALYSNSRALKLPALPETIKQKYVKFFLSARLVYK